MKEYLTSLHLIELFIPPLSKSIHRTFALHDLTVSFHIKKNFPISFTILAIRLTMMMKKKKKATYIYKLEFSLNKSLLDEFNFSI
jgi:hypothetical protein